VNGCFNRAPFKESMKVQDGWIDYCNSRMPKMIDVPFRMSKDCEYQKHDKYNAALTGARDQGPGAR